MAVKSVISIDVQDGAFQRFNALFQQYQKNLNATPLAWRRIAQEQGKGAKAFQELVALEVQSMGHQKMMLQVQQAAARITRTTSDAWRDMARNTKSVAGDIRDATTQLLKWTSLTGVFAGVIGAGGLFGINRMAEGVASGRRSSLGIGAGYGEQKAFANSFSRIVDSDSFLSGINESLHSASGKASLFGVGLKAGDLSGSTADVAMRFLQSARVLAKKSDPQFDAETMKARGIDKHMSLQDFQRLRATSDQEFSGLRSRYARNVGAFGVSGKDQLAYQNFVTTIDEAGDKLNAVFVRGLVPLIPGLEKLSTATVNAVQAFLEAPQLKKWIEGAGEGLKTFADYVGTDEFKAKVEKFVWGIGVIGDKVGSVVSWFGGGSGPGVLSPWSKEAQASGAGKPTWGVGGNAKPGDKDSSFLNGLFSPWGGDPKMKGDAGTIAPGMAALAKMLQGRVPNLNEVTAANDRFHIGHRSAHNQNRAVDMNLKDPSRHAETAEMIRAEMRRMGIAGKVIDEYANPSARSTGGHLHVQADRTPTVRIDNATGSSFNVSALQLAAGGFPQ
jgi:hypothetical protein